MKRKNKCARCGAKRLRTKLNVAPIKKTTLLGVDEHGEPVFGKYDSVEFVCFQCPKKKEDQ